VDELLAELGSPERETVAVLLRVVAKVGEFTVMAIVAVEPAAGVAGMGDVIEQETVPEELTAGVVQLHPDGTEIEEKVTPVEPEGSTSVRTLEVAGAAAWP
jgi:hypothetical protein